MYEHMTDDFLRERMLARVSEKLDKRPSSIIYDTHEATANELAILYVELEYLIKNSYGDTAAREYLILLCKDRGIIPYPSSAAVLKGDFTPDTIDVTGQRFNIDAINYVVTEQIAPGQYQVVCEMPGTIGNRRLGTMIPIDYVAGLETAELTEILIPGEDEEETEALRQRYFDSFTSQCFGGNRADYIAEIRKIEGVGDVKVARMWDGGIRPAGMIPGAKVTAWYETAAGELDEEVAAWLSSVYLAAREKRLTVGGTVLVTVVNSNDFGEVSAVLLDKIQELLDPEEYAGEGNGLAPVGHVVHVKSAVPIVININTSLIFEEDCGWDNLKPVIESAVNRYFLELRKEWAQKSSITVRISQIDARILAVAGVADIADTKLNGICANLNLGQYEIPVLGGVAE